MSQSDISVVTPLHSCIMSCQLNSKLGTLLVSNPEYADMIKALGACDGNVQAAAILHAETFPRPLRPRGKAYQTG